MASARAATPCSPDALLHDRDLLHWQTLRCLSGLGLLQLENSVFSRPALRRLQVFPSAFPGSTKECFILFKSSRQGKPLLTLLHPLLSGLVRGVDDMKKVYASGVSRHSVSFLLRLLFSSSTAEP